MLETNRLLIRNFVAEDTHSCFEGWGKDKKLGKYILGYPAEEKQMEAFVDAWSKNKNAWLIFLSVILLIVKCSPLLKRYRFSVSRI